MDGMVTFCLQPAQEAFGVDKILGRHIRYNQALDQLPELEKAGLALVLRPSRRIKVSKLERHPWKLKALYKLGRKDTERRLEEIRRFLAQEQR